MSDTISYSTECSTETSILITKSAAYDIQLIDFKAYDKILILTESSVISGTGDYLQQIVKEANLHETNYEKCHVYSTIESDFHKGNEEAEAIMNFMFSVGLTKKSLVICFGGGKISDLGGFIASIYLRGIASIYFPTTLLSMIDASIGGKCGINSIEYGKNLIGTFAQPKKIIVNLKFLYLFEDIKVIIRDGLAEMVKIIVVFDSSKSLYSKLNRLKIVQSSISGNSIFSKFTEESMIILEELVVECIKLKVSIITQDVFDSGIRNCLNFGHTIGHGVEAADTFNFSHGEAVSIGMVSELKVLSNKRVCPYSLVYELINILSNFGLPTEIPKHLSIYDMIDKMRQDKKNKSILHCSIIALKEIGDFSIKPLSVSYEDLLWMLSSSIRVTNPKELLSSTADPLIVDFIKGSKSICNRALILAAIVKQDIILQNFNICEDTSVMIRALTSFGYNIQHDSLAHTIRVNYNENNNKSENEIQKVVINIENAGTAARFLVCFVAFHLKNFSVTVHSSKRMEERPNKELFLFLEQFEGFSIEYLNKAYCFPIIIKTTRRIDLINATNKLDVTGKASSQFVSSVIMSSYSFISAHISDRRLHYLKEVSFQFIEMTMSLMKKFGMPVHYSNEGFFEFEERISIKENFIYYIEPDASTINFLIGHVAINGGYLKIKGIGHNSIQGDSKMINYLGQFGYLFKQTDHETEFFHCITNNNLKSDIDLILDLELITDSFIIFAIVASQLKNCTITIEGIDNQAVKESNRIELVAINLNRCGIFCHIEASSKLVVDTKYIRPVFHDIMIDTANDHRLAMAFTILASKLVDSHRLIITEKDCTTKTYPEFYRDMETHFGYSFTPEFPYNDNNSQYNLSKPNYENSPIIVIGMRASGKTSLSSNFGYSKGMLCLDIDQLIFSYFELLVKINHSSILFCFDEIKNIFESKSLYSTDSLSCLVEKIGEKIFRKAETELFLQIVFGVKCSGLEHDENKTHYSEINEFLSLIPKVTLGGCIISCGGGLCLIPKLQSLVSSFPNVILIDNAVENCLINLGSGHYIFKNNFAEIYEQRKPSYQKCASHQFKIPQLNREFFDKASFDQLSALFFNFLEIKLSFNKQKVAPQGSFMLCFFIEPNELDFYLKGEHIPKFDSTYELIELRFDKVINLWLNQSLEFLVSQIFAVSFFIKLANPNVKFLFTNRTVSEGGYFHGDFAKPCSQTELYYKIIKAVMGLGLYEFLDLEFHEGQHNKKLLDDVLNCKKGELIVHSKHLLDTKHSDYDKYNLAKVCLTSMNANSKVDVLKIITSIDNDYYLSKFSCFYLKNSNKPAIAFQYGSKHSYTRLFNSLYTPVYDPILTKPTGVGQMTRSEVLEARKLLKLSDCLAPRMQEHTNSFYAVLGKEVSKSCSPKLHKSLWNIENEAWFKYHNIANSDAFTSVISSKQYMFNSITMPFKEIVLPSVSYSSETSFIKSCNTLLRRGRQLFGFNTDYVALYLLLIRNLRELPQFQNIKILVVGAGGASKGVVFSLKNTNMHGSACIHIANRSDCSEFCKNFKCKPHSQDINIEYSVIISTVPKDVCSTFFEDLKINLGANCIAIDLAYDLSEKTSFRKYWDKIQSGVHKYVDGLLFLDLQGKLQYEIFSGKNLEKLI